VNEEQIERLVRDPLRKLKDAGRLTDWFQRRKMQPSGTWDVSGPDIRLRAASTRMLVAAGHPRQWGAQGPLEPEPYLLPDLVTLPRC
jgi:hypothetical protein